MSTYKLVPLKPTREMWAAAGDAVVALNSQHHDAISEAVYKAMLAAAPDFDRHVIAEVNADDDGYWADILPDRSVHLCQPLYGVMQPAPDVAELLEAVQSLLDMEEVDCRYDHEGYCQSHNLDHVDEGCRVAKARHVLMIHRKGGES